MVRESRGIKLEEANRTCSSLGIGETIRGYGFCGLCHLNRQPNKIVLTGTIL